VFVNILQHLAVLERMSSEAAGIVQACFRLSFANVA
jgi:hypothetical protein